MLRSIRGGAQRLDLDCCPDCKRADVWWHWAQPGGRPSRIDDVSGLGITLQELLAEADTDIFFLSVTSDRDSTQTVHYVMPRHQLPAFRVSDRRDL